MIRTNAVPLTTVPNAVAYRRKLSAGDVGIVIVRGDEPQPGVATISKTSGEAIVSDNTPAEAYPAEAFAEAVELTAGMPYRKQGKPAAPDMTPAPADDDNEADDLAADEVIIDSDEYQRVVDAYTDKKGRLSYDLLNKDLIQLVHRSDHVAKMIGDGAGEEEIRMHAVGTRFRGLTGNRDLTDDEVAEMARLIDEVSPKGAFKGLNAKIREMLGEAKRA